MKNESMKQLRWADARALTDYMAQMPSAAERAAVDSLAVDPLKMLQRPDLVVYSLSKALGQTVAAIFDVVA
jgi:hypothetical protein